MTRTHLRAATHSACVRAAICVALAPLCRGVALALTRCGVARHQTATLIAQRAALAGFVAAQILGTAPAARFARAAGGDRSARVARGNARCHRAGACIAVQPRAASVSEGARAPCHPAGGATGSRDTRQSRAARACPRACRPGRSAGRGTTHAAGAGETSAARHGRRTRGSQRAARERTTRSRHAAQPCATVRGGHAVLPCRPALALACSIAEHLAAALVRSGTTSPAFEAALGRAGARTARDRTGTALRE